MWMKNENIKVCIKDDWKYKSKYKSMYKSMYKGWIKV